MARGLGLCCYLLAGLLAAAAVAWPILGVAAIGGWLFFVVAALWSTATESSAAVGAGALRAAGHNPLLGWLVVALLVVVIAAMLAAAVATLVFVEAGLVLSAAGLYLLGRRLRRTGSAQPVPLRLGQRAGGRATG